MQPIEADDGAGSSLYLSRLPRPIPPDVLALPIVAGKPYPFFKAWDQFARPTDRVDPDKLLTCVEQHRCYCCGKRMHGPIAYHARASTAVSRVVPEPAMHVDCADWFARCFDPPQPEPLFLWITSPPQKVMAYTPQGVLLSIPEAQTLRVYCMNREASPTEVRLAMHRASTAIREIGERHSDADRAAAGYRMAEFEKTLARCGVGYISIQ